MKKTKVFLSLGLIVCGLLTGCGKQTETAGVTNAQAQAKDAAVEYQWDFAKKNGDIDALKEECDEKGEVITIEYETPAYAINDLKGVDETLTKTMTVYLPYGYDENGQYNVLYLLHGTRGETDPAMETIWLEGWSATRNILDNMIKEGMCEPTIVVCPTYYSEMEGYEMTEDFADYEIKFWYNGNGAGDFALENHKDFCEKVLSDIPDKFTDGQNYAFVKLRDGAHMFASWQADLYNSLLVFFK